jgi:hypothetical protein
MGRDASKVVTVDGKAIRGESRRRDLVMSHSMPIDRDRIERSVLRHIVKHGLGVAELLGKKLMPKGDAGLCLTKAREAGLLNYFTSKFGKESLIAGRVSWAYPTKKGCEEHGVPIDRSAPPSGISLHYRMAVHWDCMINDSLKLDGSELEQLTGYLPPDNVAWIIERTWDVLLRVYVPTGERKTTCEQIGRIAEELFTEPRLAPWAESRQVGILVLAETTQKCTAIKNEVRERRLEDLVPVRVRLGPSPATLESYLRLRRVDNADPNGH